MSSMTISPKAIRSITVPSSNELHVDAHKYNLASVLLGETTTLNLPTNPVNGSKVEWRITAAGGDRSVIFDPGIIIPNSSTVTSPITVGEGKTTLILIEYNGYYKVWMLVAYIDQYVMSLPG